MNSEINLSEKIESDVERKSLFQDALQELHWLRDVYPEIQGKHYFNFKAYERAEELYLRSKAEVEKADARLLRAQALVTKFGPG